MINPRRTCAWYWMLGCLMGGKSRIGILFLPRFVAVSQLALLHCPVKHRAPDGHTHVAGGSTKLSPRRSIRYGS